LAGQPERECCLSHLAGDYAGQFYAGATGRSSSTDYHHMIRWMKELPDDEFRTRWHEAERLVIEHWPDIEAMAQELAGLAPDGLYNLEPAVWYSEEAAGLAAEMHRQMSEVIAEWDAVHPDTVFGSRGQL